MSAFSPERAAATLLGARRVPRPVRRPLNPLLPGARPTSKAEGIEAQLALARLVDSGAPAGFKIGATAARMQSYLGLQEPLAGFMPRAGLHASGSTLSLEGLFQPGLECELAVHLSRDIPPAPSSPEEVAGAVDLVMTAIEVVENRYADLPAFGVPSLLADQVFHAAAILGTPVPDWHFLDLAAMTGEIEVNGEVVGEGTGADLMGHPMAALAWLAGSAEVMAFGGLRAGQIVMLGSVCPPLWVDGPAEVEVRFSPLPPVTLSLV